MKKVFLITMLMVLGFSYACVTTEQEAILPEPAEYRMKSDKEYRIGYSPGPVWKEMAAGRFNDFQFGNREARAYIWVGSRKLTSELQNADLYFIQSSWIQGMKEKYGWKDLTPIDDGRSTISGREAYWNIYELTYDNKRIKEKCYVIKGNKYYYRLRIGSSKESFDIVINDFEGYVRSFEIL